MRVERSGALLVMVLLGVASRDARAGRSGFAWFFDSEVVPERGVELETWLIEENSLGDDDRDTTRVQWQPSIGLTDRVELALPVELDFIEADDPMVGGDTQLANYGAEVRWRLVTQDPVEAPRVAPLIRLAAKRLVAARERMRTEGDLVVSADLGHCWRAVADLGVFYELGTGQDFWSLRPGAGVNAPIAADLRIGIEAFASFKRDDLESGDWIVAGPNLAWVHGRFWLAATFGIGLYGIDSAPRINWAVAF